MKPQRNKNNPQIDLFKIELNRIIDPNHPLVKLTKQMDWSAFDHQFEKEFSDEGRPAIANTING